VSYAYAGVTTTQLYPQLAERLDLPVDAGAIVAKIQPDRPGLEGRDCRAGDGTITFQGQEVDTGGDVITAVNGEKVTSNTDLPPDRLPPEPGRHGDPGQSSATATLSRSTSPSASAPTTVAAN